jgi:glucose-1-phosphate cytidylyltransferase
MKVVILCGGKGTRLREETEYRPKPMVPIGNYPIIWHIMKTYAYYGHKDFILCLGHKGSFIKDYFRNYLWNTNDVKIHLGQSCDIQYLNKKNEDDWSVVLADTGEDSMTAYRVNLIKKYIPSGEKFLLTYGDGLSNIDINKAINSHILSRKICSIAAVHPAGRFGALRIDKKDSIQTFVEKPQFEESYVNGGYMVCDYKIFDYLTTDPSVMLEREPMINLVKAKQLNAYKHEGFWQPMDTYQEMEYLNKLWRDNNAPWKVWAE